MRLIDGDALFDKVYEAFGYDIDGDMANLFMGWINEAPTLTPQNEPLTPCDVCRFSPPSSGDGKPCCLCPADRRPPEGEENA